MVGIGGSQAATGLSGIYGDHSAAVFSTACQVCGPAMAEDVTQEVFLQLLRHPERFDPARGSLRTYLLVIARHKAIDMLRAEKRRCAREHRADTLVDHAGPVEPDAATLDRDRTLRVAAALSRLPRHERDALVVAFFGGYTYQQAAVYLGQPEGSTKSRIRSGLRRLAQALADAPIDLPAAMAHRR